MRVIGDKYIGILQIFTEVTMFYFFHIESQIINLWDIKTDEGSRPGHSGLKFHSRE